MSYKGYISNYMFQLWHKNAYFIGEGKVHVYVVSQNASIGHTTTW